MKNLDGFINSLRCYGDVYENINSGCDDADILCAEVVINHDFPVDLAELYRTYNGQSNDILGIFKSLSGYNKYTRPCFLSLKDVCTLYKKLSARPYIDVFDSKLIPFAVDSIETPDDVICYDIETGVIYLLWVMITDPFTPLDWQCAKFKLSDTLDDFLAIQSLFYGRLLEVDAQDIR